MSSSDTRGPAQTILAWALIVTLGGMTFTWVHLAKLGGFDVTLAYAVTVLLGGLLLLRPAETMAAAVPLGRIILPWLVVYLTYLLILALHLAGFPDKGMLLRQIFFLLCGLTVAIAILQADDVAQVLRRGGLLAILGFLVYSETLARQNGQSWLTAVQTFILQGNLDYIVYKFLRVLFQMAGDGEVPASIKNIVAASLFVALCLYRAGHQSLLRDGWGQIVTVLIFALMVLFNTRSVLLVSLLAIILAWMLRSARAPRHTPSAIVVKAMLSIAAVTALALLVSPEQAATARIGERFSFADASTEGRLQQMSFALARIEHNILLGSGLAEINGQLVHNLFLGAWLHGGLLAFLVVVLAYAMLVTAWIRFMVRIAFQNSAWVLPVRPEWVAALPLLPLFRVWIAGDAGHPGYPEWLALLLFFGLIAVNQRANYPRLRTSHYRRAKIAFS